MNRKEVIERIKKIEDCKLDDEMARTLEYELYYDFIKKIANREYGIEECIHLARLIKRTKDIDFAR